MAVADLFPQKGWKEWKRELEEDRRKRRKERMRRWAQMEVKEQPHARVSEAEVEEHGEIEEEEDVMEKKEKLNEGGNELEEKVSENEMGEKEVKMVQEESCEDDNPSDRLESDDESDVSRLEDEVQKYADGCQNVDRAEAQDDAEQQHEDSGELESAEGKTWSNDDVGPQTSPDESKESRDQRKTDDWKQPDVGEICTGRNVELPDSQEKLSEEESKEGEETESSGDEDGEEDDVVKVYHKGDYSTDIFSTLKEFKDSSILIDLTLSTSDGKSFHVHSSVLAAVSSLIRKHLTDNVRDNLSDSKDCDISHFSVSLGPEVDHVGLEAVVAFSYTGALSSLNKETVYNIKAAAQTLGIPRVLDLCSEEVEKSDQKKEDKLSSAEQRAISLQSIKELWVHRVGCDVILDANGVSIHVHRVILVASSDYFRSMFTLGMKEARQRCVTLPFLLASELEVLIGCSYSGILPLSWQYVFELTMTSVHLQCQPALSLCLRFLQQEINPDSCLDVASFAEAYQISDLVEVAHDFVLRQFQKVASTSKFKDLPAKQLLKYLNSCSLCVPSELVVFRAVVAWIQAKPKKRLKLAKEMMETIHFPLMTCKEFKEVQSLSMWSDHSLAEFYNTIFEDFCSSEMTTQSPCRVYLPKESIILVGGDQISDDLKTRRISRDMWFGNSLKNHTGIIKAMEWRRLGEIPEPARFSHEVAVLDGQLYLFGGKKYYGTDDTLNSVYRYNPLQNSWNRLADMQEKRCLFSVVVLDRELYTIGGWCDPNHMESVEQYCPTVNSWRYTRPLDHPLSGHVGKVLQGQIFISGGRNINSQCLASMFVYHPERGSTYLANMRNPRAHHCMEALGDRLYVAGGLTTDDNMSVRDLQACEVYSSICDSWTTIMPLPVPHVGAGGAILEEKFYVLGGYSQEDYSDTKIVHRYDPATQRWENMGNMPDTNNDIRACVLCLPPHFRI
ncbi:kelch-like protein 33 [Thalassophryne amazonica]|uniref:kelch-like protein 33 n=1 Tax=Thalassophryne amazonica TaxID=390379 RepID=UPI001471EB8E|nr:kelch-like protein 33 [Thalassophryne amazonica]